MNKRLLCFMLIALFLQGTAAEAFASEFLPYKVGVDTANQLTYVYTLNEDEEYELMDVWATSSGAPGTPTIQGTFTLRPLWYGQSGEWYLFKSWPCWVNYVTQIKGNYCFHSPPTNVRYAYEKTPVSNIKQMLSAASHGCVRFLPRQAAFMWYNMAGCSADIYAGEKTSETEALREKLSLEIPADANNYPDPVVTEHTVYWYTYHGDTIEKVCSISGISPEELVALNPDFDFSAPMLPGFALRIKRPAEEQAETPEEVSNEAEDGAAAPVEAQSQPAPSVPDTPAVADTGSFTP